MSRVDVRKTYKLFIGGDFPRSESGHSYVVNDTKGRFVANAALASRKDARDAVVAARKAFPGWSSRTAYNRAQILYRVAEIMEDRRPQFVAAVRQSEGLTASRADKVVDESIDRLVWYAGWADKITQVVGNANPVAGPFFNLSTPEPTGVVAVLAPDEPDILGLIREIAPALAAGNTVVALISRRWPLRALDLGEVAGVSDVPGGVLNLLCGRTEELVTPLCGHRDVNTIVDATGASEPAATIDELAAETVKRVTRPAPDGDTLARLEALMELKTAWHPVGT
jgi:acyl-CoA reductase-like NAD-dependent aldehyde dehydrogenase